MPARKLVATGWLAALTTGFAAAFSLSPPAWGERVTEPGSAQKKEVPLMERQVPILGYSEEVENNGCHARRDPSEEIVPRGRARFVIPFWHLIERAAGKHTVLLTIRHPNEFRKDVAPLEPDMRTLVTLYALHDGMGVGDLKSFFGRKSGAVAAEIRDALGDAGLMREHEIFNRAMSLFGSDYPEDASIREKMSGAFDVQLMALAKEMGSRDALSAAMEGYVKRTPALWQKIEAQRTRLGAAERLQILTSALWDEAGAWPDDEHMKDLLARYSKEERTLLALDSFNGEFEEGGMELFFYNSTGALAPEAYEAFHEVGLPRQAEFVKRGMALFGADYPRDTEKRRNGFLADDAASKAFGELTDEFYALDGGPQVIHIGNDMQIEGGPGIRHGMLQYALKHELLPC
jgi:hypothetical protein